MDISTADFDQQAVTGDGRRSMRLTFESESSRSGDALGAYRIAADGTIFDSELLFADAGALEAGASVELGALGEGERLGLFLVNNATSPVNARFFGPDSRLVFDNPATGEPANIADFERPRLTVSNAAGESRAITDEIFHSADASPETRDRNRLNEDDRAHVASEVLEDGAIRIGFEDRADRPGARSDFDFDDLVVRVEASVDERARDFTIVGDTPDQLALDAVNLGDVDGDGRDDLGVSQPNGDGSLSRFVVFGRDDGATVRLSELGSDEDGFELAPSSFEYLSFSTLAGLGDVDGDGVDDFAVGDPSANGGGGRVYVVFGRTEGLSFDPAMIAAGEGGFVVEAPSNATLPPFFDPAGYGSIVSGVGDVDGDGLADMIVDAQAFAFSSPVLVFGKADGRSVSFDDAEPLPAGLFEGAAPIGDFDGDGVDDFALIDPGLEGVSGLERDGSVTVVFGDDSRSAFEQATISTDFRFAFDRVAEVRAPGDANGDGADDLLIELRPNSGDVVTVPETFLVEGAADFTSLSLGEDVANGVGGGIAAPIGFFGDGDGDFDGDGVRDALRREGDRIVVDTRRDASFGEVYDTLIGFGDSLVDGGNAQILANVLGAEDPTPAALGYAEGRFSSGPAHFDLLYSAIALAPSFDFAASAEVQLGLEEGADGVNFALGGARATAGERIGLSGALEVGTGLAAQVESYAALLEAGRVFGGETPENALAAINVGGNDVRDFLLANSDFDITPQELGGLARSIGEAHALAIEDLIDLGVEDALVAGVSNIGAIPEVANGVFGGDLKASTAALAPITDAVNDGIEAALRSIAAPGLDLYFFRPDSSEVVETPDRFDLDSRLFTRPFVEDVALGEADLDDLFAYAFIDAIHPTEALQTEFARQAFAADPITAPALFGPSVDADAAAAMV